MNLGMETETLEFKKSTGELKEAMNSICAMLNKHHYGELIFWSETRWERDWTNCDRRVFT